MGILTCKVSSTSAEYKASTKIKQIQQENSTNTQKRNSKTKKKTKTKEALRNSNIRVNEVLRQTP
jgi:hypothetical protein